MQLGKTLQFSYKSSCYTLFCDGFSPNTTPTHIGGYEILRTIVYNYVLLYLLSMTNKLLFPPKNGMHHLNLCSACACVSESIWQNRQLKTLTFAVITPQHWELVVKYQLSLNAYSFPKVAMRIVQTLMLKGLMHKAQANTFIWLQANHSSADGNYLYMSTAAEKLKEWMSN